MLVSLTVLALASAAAPMPQAAAGSAPPPAQPSAPIPAPTPAPAPPPPAPPSAGTGEAGNIGFFTAATLARRCQDSSPAAISYCYAYITAVHDTMKAYEIWLSQREFCIGGGNAQADLRRAFLTYLSAYPENGSGQAASVVAVALKQTFTCPPDPRPVPPSVPEKMPAAPKSPD